MIPLRDDIRSRRVPVVNYALIAITSIVFLLQLSGDARDASLVEQFGMIPKRVLHPDEPITIESLRYHPRQGLVRVQHEAAPSPIPGWLTILTCIFLHGGWMHFISNMWFLFIFGDNVEDRLGRWGFVLFYVGSGVAASITHLATDPSSSVPTIGASGAIAGVMGAYFLLYPRATVLTLIPIVFFIQLVHLPAWLFLGFWFVIQFFQGSLALTADQTTGVAWWAHIGGFAVGFAVIYGLRLTGRLKTGSIEVIQHARGPIRFGRHGRWRR